MMEGTRELINQCLENVLPIFPGLRAHLPNGSRPLLLTHSGQDETLRSPSKTKAHGIHPWNAQQSFAIRVLIDDAVKLVKLAGKAGTGEALRVFTAALETRSKFQQMLLAQPIVPLRDRRLSCVLDWSCV